MIIIRLYLIRCKSELLIVMLWCRNGNENMPVSFTEVTHTSLGHHAIDSPDTNLMAFAFTDTSWTQMDTMWMY